MTRKTTIIKSAVEIVSSKMADGRSQKSIADELGVVSAHIWRLLNKGYLSPTLQQAMVEAGWLEISKRSPRISIQRDNPEAAARSIINLAGKEMARKLARELRRQAGGLDHWEMMNAPSMSNKDDCSGSVPIPVIMERWLVE